MNLSIITVSRQSTAKQGQFDGIEFQASHSSILRQFLSPYSNKRTDSYGGSLEKPFPSDQGKSPKQYVPLSAPTWQLGIRLSGEEFIEGRPHFRRHHRNSQIS